MTDKEKIREEVERLREKILGIRTDFADGQKSVLTKLLAFIDTLQEEPVSDDLEQAAKDYSNNLDNIYGSIGKQTRNAFKAGAEWQKEQDKETIELAEDHAMLAGMEKMKEEMMAKAIEVTVHIDSGGYPYIPQIELYDYDKDVPLAKEGGKYKVVLIKGG
jgi:hypothetical protein